MWWIVCCRRGICGSRSGGRAGGVGGWVAEMCRGGKAPEIWGIRRRLASASLPARPVVFSGIARPESFVAMLAEAGCEAVEEVRFRDHHRYTEADIERLVGGARQSGADGFVTTEKDAVKLSGAMRERLGGVVVAGVRGGLGE